VVNPVISELLGCEFPILAFSHCRDVVAAVSAAGGFGVLGATKFTAEELEIELLWIDEHSGGRPYGVDMLIPHKYQKAPSRAESEAKIPAEYRHFLSDLLERYGVPDIDSDANEGHKGLKAGDPAETARELLDVSFRHPIKLVASALGPPPGDIVDLCHSKDVLVTGLAGKVKHAVRQKEAGVDFVVTTGYEAGGHTGEITTMVLVPDVVDAIGPLPVVAAGGIATGRQVAAAIALGAAGVWTGSVWTTTDEAETHPMLRQKMLAATASDTVRSRCMSGKTVRLLQSDWTESWDEPSAPSPLPMPLQAILVNDFRGRIDHAARRPDDGATKLLTGPVGQVVGRLNAIRSARQVLLEMAEEYADTIAGFAKLDTGE
jgi:NAD(P)H-dependent flavin oxidoreductase YrpB (nitropropane dioxygenase family)